MKHTYRPHLRRRRSHGRLRSSPPDEAGQPRDRPCRSPAAHDRWNTTHHLRSSPRLRERRTTGRSEPLQDGDTCRSRCALPRSPWIRDTRGSRPPRLPQTPRRAGIRTSSQGGASPGRDRYRRTALLDDKTYTSGPHRGDRSRGPWPSSGRHGSVAEEPPTAGGMMNRATDLRHRPRGSRNRYPSRARSSSRRYVSQLDGTNRSRPNRTPARVRRGRRSTSRGGRSAESRRGRSGTPNSR